jgi:stage II sporulation protein B
LDKHVKAITIKINGKDHPINLENTVENDAASNKDGAISEIAASQESLDDHFDWILPDQTEEETLQEYIIAPKQYNKQKKKPGIAIWNKKNNRNKGAYATIILTIFFAILLGSAFGVTILKLVTADTEAKLPVTEKVDSVPEKTPAGSESLKLGSINVFVLQNNIFSTEAAAQEMRQVIEGKGINAEIFPVNGQYAIYMGIAGSLEEAKKTGETIKASGVDMYAKPVEIIGGTADGLSAEEVQFLQQAPEIFSILSTGTAGNSEVLQKVETFQSMLGKLSDKEGKDKNMLKAMMSMETASKAFLTYQQTKDGKQLVDMNQALLSFLSAYQSLGK